MRHAKRRAAERYGLDLDGPGLRLLSNKIQCGLAMEFEKESKFIRKFFVETASGVEIPVVYNTKRGRIITVLPQDAAEVRRAIGKRNLTMALNL